MRRLIAIIAALALAGVGTFFLVGYVRGAEDRALAGEIVVEVLVADAAIAAGTASEDLAGLVRLEQVPAKVAAVGAVGSLSALADRVAAIDLLPGEQLVDDRFLAPEAYQDSLGGGPKVEVPADLLQVTISLSPERVVGGELGPGDRVAVFASFDPFRLGTVEPTGLGTGSIPVLVPDEGEGAEDGGATAMTPNSTKIILLGVLVTNLQAEELPPAVDEEDTAAGTPDLAPTGNLLITLALTPADAARLVFTAEHGFVWLALQGSDADATTGAVETRVSIYEAP